MPLGAASHGSEVGEGRALYLLKIAALAAVYYAAAKLGLDLAFTTESVTAIWAPTGIALAAVILWGYRIWPGIALGAFLANAWTDVPLYTALGITAGNTLEAMVGAYLLSRFAAFRPSLERVRDVVALVVLGGVVSTTVSATIGVGSLLAAGEIDSADLASVWRTWWLGDMGGDLVVAPALLVAATHWPYRQAPGRPLEAAGLGLLIAGVTALVFTSESSTSFLIFPPLIVATMRLWQPGAVAGCLLVACIAIPLTADGNGPFSDNSPDERLLLAQALIGVASLTTLVLAAVIAERSRVEYALRHIADTLQESLLPSRLPEIPGIEVAIDYRPAGEGQRVGGDFYDLYSNEDGSWAVIVGDVIGKDASAAATTALVRYTLRAAAVHEPQPSGILQKLNDAILRQTAGQSCTVAYSRLELGDAGRARVTLSSGGHPLPLVLRAYGGVELAGAPGMVLGVRPDPLLEDDTVDLAAGDALVFYTDGLTDAHAPSHVVSVQELAIALRACAGFDASDIARKLTRTVLDRGPGDPRDDILLFVLRIPPLREPSASAPVRRGTDSSPARHPAS
ncbi:MAG: PP2C family protein-serine/threonine phosphatase [Solirubrobacterales bacterium]